MHMRHRESKHPRAIATLVEVLQPVGMRRSDRGDDNWGFREVYDLHAPGLPGLSLRWYLR